MSERIAQLLAHPLRDRVLYEYRGRPAAPSEVARRLGQPLNVVSYHTRVLERHGYLELVRQERRRGVLTRFFRAIGQPLIDDQDWIGLSVGRRRHLALETLDRTEAETGRAALAGALDALGVHISRSPLELDLQGIAECSAALREAFERITEIDAAARGRGGHTTPTLVVILGFAASAPPDTPARR